MLWLINLVLIHSWYKESRSEFWTSAFWLSIFVVGLYFANKQRPRKRRITAAESEASGRAVLFQINNYQHDGLGRENLYLMISFRIWIGSLFLLLLFFWIMPLITEWLSWQLHLRRSILFFFLINNGSPWKVYFLICVSRGCKNALCVFSTSEGSWRSAFLDTAATVPHFVEAYPNKNNYTFLIRVLYEAKSNNQTTPVSDQNFNTLDEVYDNNNNRKGKEMKH